MIMPVLHPTYPIETARLHLRPLVEADFGDFSAYDSMPEVARYLYWEPRGLAESREAFEAHLHRTALEGEGDALVLGIVWREVGKVVGHVSLGWVSSEHQTGEIGFIVSPAYQGHGLAMEAAEVMLGLGFDGLRFHRMFGRCDGRNLSSARLMERLGMRREAHLVENEYVKGEWTDELIYAMLDREWQARRSLTER
jgi:RimJ/RimL family protein N-acetyltransferase